MQKKNREFSERRAEECFGDVEGSENRRKRRHCITKLLLLWNSTFGNNSCAGPRRWTCWATAVDESVTVCTMTVTVAVTDRGPGEDSF